MKSLQITTFGAPADVVELVELEEPASPAAGDVLAAVEYAPINSSDLLLMRGVYGVKPPLPAPLGQEAVGRVLEVGRSVSNLRPGDRVVIPNGRPVWRERVVFEAAGLTPAPAEADPRQLSMIHINPPTAGLLLKEFVDLKPGDWIIQNAANSGVGRNVIAFAREFGLRTVSLVRRESLVGDLRQAGADVVLLDRPGVAKEVAEATGRAKIHLALDGVAGDATLTLLTTLAPGGKLVFYAGASGKPGAVSPVTAIFSRISVVGFWLGHPEWRSSPKVVEHEATAVRLIAEGKLKAPIAAVYPLSDAKAAIAHAQKGGKILLQPTV